MSESQAKEQKAIMASDVVEATVGEDLDEILARLCNLTEEAAVKEGKLKGTSAFKLSSLKKIAKQRGLVVGLAKPDMINRIRENVTKEKVLESVAEKERSGTYRHDKNTFPIGQFGHAVPGCAPAVFCVGHSYGPPEGRLISGRTIFI